MAYHEFTLGSVQKSFGLKIECADLFSSVEPCPLSELTRGALKLGSPLALASRTEKAKSECIIAPIMLAWASQLARQISLFSGHEFNVDPACGLGGNCAYLITKGNQPLVLTAPVIIILEFNGDDEAGSGLGRCVAEMVAAQITTERRELRC